MNRRIHIRLLTLALVILFGLLTVAGCAADNADSSLPLAPAATRPGDTATPVPQRPDLIQAKVARFVLTIRR